MLPRIPDAADAQFDENYLYRRKPERITLDGKAIPRFLLERQDGCLVTIRFPNAELATDFWDVAEELELIDEYDLS